MQLIDVSDNFVGTVWLHYFAEKDTTYNMNIDAVTFEPGARTNRHSHKGGQILLVTDERGLYQEQGKLVAIIEKGQVLKYPPDIVHWHGATPTDAMPHTWEKDDITLSDQLYWIRKC